MSPRWPFITKTNKQENTFQLLSCGRCWRGDWAGLSTQPARFLMSTSIHSRLERESMSSGRNWAVQFKSRSARYEEFPPDHQHQAERVKSSFIIK